MENQNKKPSPLLESKLWLEGSWERRTGILRSRLNLPGEGPPHSCHRTEWILHMSVRERDLSLLSRIGGNALKPIPLTTV